MRLILPVAGQSSRFPGVRPKWLLQHPDGITMLEKSIEGFSDWSVFDEIIIVAIESQLLGTDEKLITDSINSKTGVSSRFLTLPEQTASVVETVLKCLEHLDDDSSFIVKDCDNFVLVDSGTLASESNVVVYADLQDFPGVSAHNKSFIELGATGHVENFVEKRIISGLFSVGLTKFESASSFMAGFLILEEEGARGGETYISHVVRSVMGMGNTFKGVQTAQYEDWGTLERWHSMTSQYATLFVDVDGIVAVNASRISQSNNWSSFRPLMNNVNTLLELQGSGKVSIIFTTSRTEEYKSVLEAELVEKGFASPQIIMGLPHAKRILVNDFSATNSYPSASAICIGRDSDNLGDYLRGLL